MTAKLLGLTVALLSLTAHANPLSEGLSALRAKTYKTDMFGITQAVSTARVTTSTMTEVEINYLVVSGPVAETLKAKIIEGGAKTTPANADSDRAETKSADGTITCYESPLECSIAINSAGVITGDSVYDN